MGRYSLFRSTTTTDLRARHMPEFESTAIRENGRSTNTKRCGKSTNVSANNLWWMPSSRVVTRSLAGKAPTNQTNRISPDGAYRGVPAMGSNRRHPPLYRREETWSGPVSSQGSKPREKSAGQQQRLLGTTRAEHDHVVPGKPICVDKFCAYSIGRSFGHNHPKPMYSRLVGADVPSCTIPQVDRMKTSFIPLPLQKQAVQDSHPLTSSAHINGGSIRDQDGLILPAQSDPTTNQVQFQVDVQKGNSEKRFQISTRLEDIRRTHEAKHLSIFQGEKVQLNDKEDDISFGPQLHLDEHTGPSNTGTPYKQKLASILREKSSNIYPKHGGLINSTRSGSLVTTFNQTPQNQKGHSGILKHNDYINWTRDSKSTDIDYGWQRKIDGANLTWSEYFCVSLEDTTEHNYPQPALTSRSRASVFPPDSQCYYPHDGVDFEGAIVPHVKGMTLLKSPRTSKGKKHLKRSVRFSTANEVHEYEPTLPLYDR